MPDSHPTIRHPANYVPLAAVAIGNVNTQAVPVSSDNPFPCSDQPLTSIRALAPDTPVDPGLALLVDCSAAGKIVLEFADATQLPLSFSPGVTMLPFSIRNVISTGTTATFTAWVLD